MPEYGVDNPYYTPVPAQGSYDNGAMSETPYDRARRIANEQGQQQQGINPVAPIAGGAYLYNKFPNVFGSATPIGGGESIVGGQVISPTGEAIATANPGFVPPAPAAGPSTFGMIAGPALIGHGLYQLGTNWGKKNPVMGGFAGAEIGGGAALLGATPWAIPAAAVLGAGLGTIKTGKHEDQIARDQVRKAMLENGIIDQNYGLELADGTKFNIGLDGGTPMYNVDANHKFSGQAVGWANPLAYILTGGDKKLATDFAGYFANAAMSNAETMEGVRGNILKAMESMKLSPDMAMQKIGELLSAGKISEQEAAAFRNSIATLIQGDPKTYVTQSIAEMQQAAPPPQTTAPAPPQTDPNLAAMPQAPVDRPMAPAKRIMSFADAKYAGRH